MSTIHTNFYRIQCKSRYKTKQTDNASKIEVQADKSKLSKVSIDNMKANYLVNFKGGIKFEKQ